MNWFKRHKKITLLILVIGFSYIGLAFGPKPHNTNDENPFLIEDELPILIAHGGGNHEFPDNTLEAYYNAYSVDPNMMLETDVSLTKDGVIILSHDTTLDKKTRLLYTDIIDINYDDLMADAIDFGYDNIVEPKSNGYNGSETFIPYVNYLGETVTPRDVAYPPGIEPRHETKFLATTLEDIIKAFPHNRINVEIKQEGDIGTMALDAVIALMDRLDDSYNTFDRIVLASFHDPIFEYMVELKETTYPNLNLSPARDSVRTFFILTQLRLSVFYQDPVAVLQVPPKEGQFNLATKHFINTAHKHNIAVHYWTINDEETMRELIALGVDGIMTDRPSLLKTIYDDAS